MPVHPMMHMHPAYMPGAGHPYAIPVAYPPRPWMPVPMAYAQPQGLGQGQQTPPQAFPVQIASHGSPWLAMAQQPVPSVAVNSAEMAAMSAATAERKLGDFRVF